MIPQTADRPAPSPTSLRPGARVAVLTGTYGAGHNSAARELDRALTAAGCTVETFDVVDLLPMRLGHARLTGALEAPVVTYLTDTSVHSLWIHPGVDLNLAVHEVAAEEARSLGGRTQVVRPLVDIDEWLRGTQPEPVGMPPVPWALVTGGSLGMGDLTSTARDLREDGRLVPVVLCGTDSRLRRSLTEEPGVVPLGWRDDVPALMASATCIVQNAGGFTSLQALASGTPVITYRPLAGHGVTNSANLDAAGLVPWARSRSELGPRLTEALRAARVSRLPADAPKVLDVLTGQPTVVAA